MTKIIEFTITDEEVLKYYEKHGTGPSNLFSIHDLYDLMEKKGCLFKGFPWLGNFKGELISKYIPEEKYTWYKQIIKEEE